MKEDDDIQRYSIIMKVKKDNTWFICNRNSNDFDSIFNDKYVKFWEIGNISSLKFSECDSVEILEYVPLDNYNRRHQTILNEYKQKYIDKMSLEDIELSNKSMTQIKKQYRNIYYEQYKDLLKSLKDIESINDKIYEYAKKLFYTDKDNSWFYEMTRDEIWRNKKWSKEQKVIFIILRDHIYYKKYHLKTHYPFYKGQIKHEINSLVRKIYKL